MRCALWNIWEAVVLPNFLMPEVLCIFYESKSAFGWVGQHEMLTSSIRFSFLRNQQDRNQIWSILLKCKLLFGISNKQLIHNSDTWDASG
ncbi:hypothetical protein MUK42_33141 [Musa troglodytarum]|uniref:Uncharacterized protein n=1 Tax=Musa troglodytarum TaxID=320322 RepID=A0A9E7JIU3_9LILI|nr:hypothetical protein MUK42_33141 [Musa troglodytarum]